jgi:DNA-binding PadR family transcriptional regulator
MTALRKTTASEDGLAGPALNIMLALGIDALHGYAIMQNIAERSQGAIRILPGTLYSTLRKLLADGLVEECAPPRGADSDDARRRYYRVTKEGRGAARAEMERLAVLVKLGKAFS